MLAKRPCQPAGSSRGRLPHPSSGRLRPPGSHRSSRLNSHFLPSFPDRIGSLACQSSAPASLCADAFSRGLSGLMTE